MDPRTGRLIAEDLQRIARRRFAARVIEHAVLHDYLRRTGLTPDQDRWVRRKLGLAIAFDGSAPANINTVNASQAFGAFTAPNAALLACLVAYDTTNAATTATLTCTDSTGDTWTKQVERTGAEATAGGASIIFTDITTSSVSRTITIAETGTGFAGSTHRKFGVIYVMTGADTTGTPVDTVGAGNEGGSATNNLTTTSITAGAAGQLLATGAEWNALGAPTSSDLTGSAFHQATELSGFTGHKTVSSGAGVTGNLDASGAAAAQWKWCQIIARDAGGGGATVTYPQLESLLRGVNRGIRH